MTGFCLVVAARPVPGKNKFGEVSGFPMEESMYFNDENGEEGGSPQKPVINWDVDEKYAIIAFLLKSVDNNIDKDGLARFDDWFGLKEQRAAFSTARRLVLSMYHETE
jgi:hypothetical protein